jgi:hypothetical protein
LIRNTAPDSGDTLARSFLLPRVSTEPRPLYAVFIWRKLMKLVQSLLVAALVAVPAVSFAQSTHALTRADVRAELVQLQKAGYNPASDNTQYPSNIEAAEARIAAQNGSASAAYGGVEQSRSAAGSHSSVNHVSTSQQDVVGLGPIYAHS